MDENLMPMLQAGSETSTTLFPWRWMPGERLQEERKPLKLLNPTTTSNLISLLYLLQQGKTFTITGSKTVATRRGSSLP
jgi:hypothetical protein